MQVPYKESTITYFYNCLPILCSNKQFRKQIDGYDLKKILEKNSIPSQKKG